MRHPDEILNVLDQAQAKLSSDEFDLRSLLWEVIEDIIDTVRGNAETNGIPQEQVDELVGNVTDYVVNGYGDD